MCGFPRCLARQDLGSRYRVVNSRGKNSVLGVCVPEEEVVGQEDKETNQRMRCCLIMIRAMKAP